MTNITDNIRPNPKSKPLTTPLRLAKPIAWRKLGNLAYQLRKEVK